jgi:hypothetical protein
MSVTTRIRLVRAIATSIAVAVAGLVLLGLWASIDELPGVLASAAALTGMLLITTISVARAFSLNPSERRLALKSQAKQQLQPQTSYRFPPA